MQRLSGVTLAFRLAGAIGAAVLMAAGASACASPGPGSSASSLATGETAHFTGNGLSFEYPAAWRSQWWEDTSSFSHLITYLSPSTLHNPCSQSTTATSRSVSCGFPIQELPAGGVLVTWTVNGFFGAGRIKANATVDDHAAVVTKNRPGSCAPIGGDETITVEIRRAAADNWYTMTACIRAPGLHQDELVVQKMLKTVRISTSW